MEGSVSIWGWTEADVWKGTAMFLVFCSTLIQSNFAAWISLFKPPVWECSVWIPIKQRMIFFSFGNGVYSVSSHWVSPVFGNTQASFINFLDSHLLSFTIFALCKNQWVGPTEQFHPHLTEETKLSKVNVPQVSWKSLPGCQGMVSVGHPIPSGKDKICTEDVHFLPQHLSLCVCTDLSDGSRGTQGRAQGPALPNGWIRS